MTQLTRVLWCLHCPVLTDRILGNAQSCSQELIFRSLSNIFLFLVSLGSAIVSVFNIEGQLPILEHNKKKLMDQCIALFFDVIQLLLLLWISYSKSMFQVVSDRETTDTVKNKIVIYLVIYKIYKSCFP